MLLRLLLILSLGFLVASCTTAPPLTTVCVSDPPSHGFQCYDPRTEKSYFLNYDESENYVAFSPDEAHALFDFCSERD